MDSSKNMIIAKDKIITLVVKKCIYDNEAEKWLITFNNGKVYTYSNKNVLWLKEPEILPVKLCNVFYKNNLLSNVIAILKFTGQSKTYYHIQCRDGNDIDSGEEDIRIDKIVTIENNKIFLYLKELAKLSEIKNTVTNETILPKQFEKIKHINDDVILSRYLGINKESRTRQEYIPIFPFGCNSSQYKAVKKALESDFSIIQGPPGTGKTQTILNIIANIIMMGKTVQVVSNNNSAIKNILEKLSLPEYGLDFIVANLGKAENKENFIANQKNIYPDFANWLLPNEVNINKIKEKSFKLQKMFLLEEKAALLRQELSQIDIEKKYFNEYAKNILTSYNLQLKKSINLNLLMNLWQENIEIKENNSKINLWHKIINIFKYGIINWDFYNQDIDIIIASIQKLIYEYRIKEIRKELDYISDILKNNRDLLNEMINESMMLLKNKLASKYQYRKNRRIFNIDELWKAADEFLAEYPVILSTTFSSKSSLNSGVVYDYLIMDEASQVDLATGALALSCARNAIIVGDTKQLPNIVTTNIKVKAEKLFKDYDLPSCYRYDKSFLQSAIEAVDNIPQTLLKEHYRCHPKIINFCNQKFYGGQLTIMTKDGGESDVLKVIKTTKGNHERRHYNQREIDVIKKEILPYYVSNGNKIGIITPYRAQVNSLLDNISEIEIDTVHKFQGREKDIIILSTVDDQITEFVDNPYLLNVAVSRAKKQLVIVVSGNEQKIENNINDLIDYIEYNNFEITDSNVFSVFDYLYKQYDDFRKEYLRKYKKISEYDSENLMYALILDVLKQENLIDLDVICHLPLRMLIKNYEFLDREDIDYVKNYATHLDFLIYNKLSKKPVLAIEVDGYEYHKKGTKQYFRDKRKEKICKIYGINLIRFNTNGSGERDILLAELKKYLNNIC